ncbi:hypothetical protein N1851_006588 [Merluccius polli]|uniref:Uncharacterized protein n=1 Tax=Merluccius polli TaxID=89951 RepID=A0AA47N418_MERPO|nr:hypothetical protein N1851_006588 [Merluccius polli]
MAAALLPYPKLRLGGGFELLKISGTTRSRNLILIPCPNEGYHIGHATLFIRPLQRNLNLDPDSRPDCSNELIGPPQKCVGCGEEFPFSRIKAHSNECIRPSQSSGEVEVATESANSSRSEDWQVAPNSTEAAKRFKEAILSQHATGKSLSLTMDLRDCAVDRERALLSFYKMANVEWACPLTCTHREIQQLVMV